MVPALTPEAIEELLTIGASLPNIYGVDGKKKPVNTHNKSGNKGSNTSSSSTGSSSSGYVGGSPLPKYDGNTPYVIGNYRSEWAGPGSYSPP